jgi:tetratricopeptide (TPR) repeat protein
LGSADKRMKPFYSILVAGLGSLLAAGCVSSVKPTGTDASAAAASAMAGDPDDVGGELPGEESRLTPVKGNPDAFAHFAAGITYRLNDEDREAIGQFDDAALADPANEPLVIELAQLFLKNKETGKAIAVLSKSAGRPDATGAVLGWLARAQLEAGHTEAALAAAKRAVQKEPGSLDGYECQVEVYFRNNQWGDALKTLHRATRQIEPQPEALVTLANLYVIYLKNQPKETESKAQALTLLDRAATQDIDSIRLRQRMAETYAALDQPAKAAEVYDKLLAEYPDGSPQRDAIHEKLAGIYFQADDKTNAMKELRALLRDDPTRYPRAWFFLGELADEDGNSQEAVNDFQNALHGDANIEQAYYDLALAQLDLHQTTSAFATLDQARDKFAKTFLCEFYTGVIESSVKHYPEAVRHFKEAEVIALATDKSKLDQRFYFQFGAACERNKEYQEAGDYLQKCIDLQPDFAEALNYLGYMLADLGEQLPRARGLIEKAIKLEPKNGAYLDSLGWVLFKLHQPDQALPWLVKAEALSPEPDATVLDHLGEVYRALHQTGKAIEAWKKSLSVESNDEVKRKLDLISGGS